MKPAIELLNKLEHEKVISPYAIGGSVGALFYVEVTHTEDVDAFTIIHQTGILLDLSHIYQAAKDLGAVVDKEHLVIGGWKIQVLPARNALVEDALKHAVSVAYEGLPTRVFTAEYLCAIMVDTCRPKDKIRFLQFVDGKKVDLKKVQSLCKSHGLSHRFTEWVKLSQEGASVGKDPKDQYIALAKRTVRRINSSMSWEDKMEVLKRMQKNASVLRDLRN